MKSKNTLKIVIYIEIIYNLFIKLLINDYNLSSFFNYLTDFFNIVLLIGTLLLFKKKSINRIKVKSLLFPILLLFISLFSFALDYTSFILPIWAIRNIYRFFVFFYCSINILEKEDLKKIFNILEKVYIINFILCMYEYYIKGIKYDNLGGIFGNNTLGGNGPLNVFLVIMIIYAIVCFFKKEKSIVYTLFIIITAIVIGSYAELKIIYIELIVILITYFIITTKSFKNLLLIIISVIVLSFGLNIYSSIYSENKDILSFEFVETYSKNSTYGSQTIINRFSGIPIIRKQIFLENKKYNIIGLGLGNAETTQFDDFQSNFYRKYGNLTKYQWFFHIFLFIECGYIGIVLYLMFFISIALYIIKNKQINEKYSMITMFLIPICIIMFFYNNTLRVETMGYMIFCILASPYIIKKGEKNEG